MTAPGVGGDFSGFQPEFAKYQVVIGNYNEFPKGDKWPPLVIGAFEQFVRNGGGYVSYHAADNAFPDWTAYNLMIGIGGWMGRDEKSGPYWYFQEGKLVSDNRRGGRQSRSAQTVPDRHARCPASDHEGPALISGCTRPMSCTRKCADRGRI